LKSLPPELIAYHHSGKPPSGEIAVQPWGCEFWPLDQVLKFNLEYEVPLNAPGYLGFATSGGGEMYAFSPRGSIVCLAFIGMSPSEELAVAPSWLAFEEMLAEMG
jgi:hypothetical protein